MSIHTKTSLDYIKRAPFQALAAISVLGLTFFVVTILSVLVYSSNKVLGYFETRPQVIAFLKNEATSEVISALQAKLTADTRVKNVNFVSKDEALGIYRKATSDNPLLAELVSPTIFPASLEFSVVDLSFAKNVIDQVKLEPIVESVGFTASLGGQESLGDVVERLKSATFYLRLGGGILVGVLTLTSFLVLMVVIGMRVTTRRGEIETLSLIGATAKFIRAPIVLEALVYAAIGVSVGFLIGLISILYISPTLITYFGEIPVLPKQALGLLSVMGVILGGEVVVGFVIALLGSSIAINRALKVK